MIALITPTGGREKQINLCAEFMRRQDYKGDVVWLLIDDAVPITTDCICIQDGFGKNWQIEKIYPLPVWKLGQNTQARNLIVGATVAKQYEGAEAVFIIEDDDYYSPQYLSKMMEHLQGYDMTGEIYSIYYNPILRGYMRCTNANHASLFQVAFRAELLDLFEQACRARRQFIDIDFFRMARQAKKKINLFNNSNLAIGIKGLPGRAGIGIGHRRTVDRLTADFEFNKLQQLIGEDYKYYINESTNIHNGSGAIR